MKKEASPNHRMPGFLEKEARGADAVILWLDCDKEGENICFEVLDCIRQSINGNVHCSLFTMHRIFFFNLGENSQSQIQFDRG